MFRFFHSPILSFSILGTVAPLLATGTPPAIGDKAPDFTLSTIEGKTVSLSQVVSNGPVVLIVLRGYPGYQCPFCSRQAQDFIQKSRAFAEADAQVVMVYPGPPQDLGVLAKEFMADKSLPNNFHLLLDPGYTFTNLYGLRWAAPRETAYPSAFLIEGNGVVFYSKVVRAHGGRATAAEILEALSKRKPAQR